MTSTYTYYADGQRKALSVASSMLTATNLFTYSYRVDGLLQTQGLGGGMTGSFSWTYKPSGRELTQSDPYTGTAVPTGSGTQTLVPRSQHYDAYGQVDSLTLPEGFTYSSIAYDTEGENLGSVRTIPSGAAGTLAQSYSVRGELVGQSLGGTGLLGAQMWSYHSTTWNGFLDCSGPIDPTTHQAPCNYKLDARSSMTLQSYMGAIGYDAAGRNTTTTAGTNLQTRAYDAENHLASQTYTGSGGQYQCNGLPCPGPPVEDGVTPPTTLPNGSGATYAWGPSGHLLEATSSSPGSGGVASEHWDGDSVLLEQSTVPSSVGADLQIGKLAVAPFSGSPLGVLSVEDRDLSGNIVATHTNAAFSGFGDVRSFKAQSKFGTVTIPSPGGSAGPSVLAEAFTTPILSAAREDGYGDAWGNVFQGVRVYDPTMAQWTAPDAYAGDVHDPMSQKPFMWNNNNPLDFEDPSGYDTIEMVARQALTGDPLSDKHIFILVTKDDGTVERFSYGPKDGVGSQLVRKDQNYDAPYNARGGQHPFGIGVTQLAACKGTCTAKNGGFNEASLAHTANVIDNANIKYGFPGPNSNSAAYTSCVAGGGGDKCNSPNTGWTLAPGWGQLLPPPPPANPPKSGKQ